MAELQNFFNVNLKALELSNIKFTDKLLERHGIELLPLNRVRTLTLSNFPITLPATFSKLKSYIETDNVFLRQLNLSRVYLNGKQLSELLVLINDCKRTLTSLNLSFNCNHNDQKS